MDVITAGVTAAMAVVLLGALIAVTLILTAFLAAASGAGGLHVWGEPPAGVARRAARIDARIRARYVERWEPPGAVPTPTLLVLHGGRSASPAGQLPKAA